MKEARVSFNRPRNQYIIRYWSEAEHEWMEDSAFNVITDCADIEWIPAELIWRLSHLQELGYTAVFVF